MTESPMPPADPNSTPEDPDAAPAPNPGEDPGGAQPPADPYTGSEPAPGADSGQGDPVDPVQEGAPATGPEAPQPPTG
ncbi:hypothetical protein [Aeromicrobium sp. Root236]|uniref:hypothetical protein n=1 Tax=Aeromicrobium sp. Root236 TaxID=1736498 RepID=UPI000B26F4F1|nr:hypothetical protein [Aeromicrobium sp. Root236]